MRRLVLLSLFLLGATRAALAVTCGGFSIVTADHIVVKYSAPVAAGATRSTPVVSIAGTNITVTRTLSGGSATDVSCVDDTIDLGYLGAGRFNVTWNDNVNFTTQRSTFPFLVGTLATGQPRSAELINLVLPALPDRPVRLEVDSCSQNPAVAYFSGNDIYISEYQGPRTNCKISVLDLGILPEGTYNVTWPAPELYNVNWSEIRFRFMVQQPAPTSTCTGRSTITPMPGGTARLHIEDSYRGYTPAFGPPTVTGIDDDWPGSITVSQTVADTANAMASGAAPSSAICHAEELNLGPITDGYHQVAWWYDVNVNEVHSYWGTLPFSFSWQNGTVQCTSDPGGLLNPTAFESAPVDVTLNILPPDPERRTVLATHVDGHTITVDVGMYSFPEGGIDGPGCQTFKTTVAPLPAGEYTVLWRFDGGQRVYTTPLTVIKPTRQRAAHH